MNLEELLGRFRSEDIAQALRASGLAASGTKSQRLARLLSGHTKTDAADTLALFRTDDLHRVCIALGVDTGLHAEMVEGLALQADSEGTQQAPAVAAQPDVARLSGLKRVGVIAAIAALLYRAYRAIRRRR